MGEGSVFPIAPGRFRLSLRVRASLDDVGDDGAEATTDLRLGQERLAGVLDRVVEQGRDGLVFGGALLEGDGRDGEGVLNVRDPRALA
jgi:hypothetical protein